MSLNAVPWPCMHAVQRGCMIKVHELSCNSMCLHPVPWACMQFHELAYSSMTLYAVPLACMQFHELKRSSKSLHTDRWACMRCHELSCSSMTCTKFHTVPYFSVWAAHKNFAMIVYPYLVTSIINYYSFNLTFWPKLLGFKDALKFATLSSVEFFIKFAPSSVWG